MKVGAIGPRLPEDRPTRQDMRDQIVVAALCGFLVGVVHLARKTWADSGTELLIGEVCHCGPAGEHTARGDRVDHRPSGGTVEEGR